MSYSINGVKYSEFSAGNQRIVDKLLNREVYCCMTAEMEYMLSKVCDYRNDDDWKSGNSFVENPFTEDDIWDTYRRQCSKCESNIGFTKMRLSELKDEDFPLTEENTYECPICGREYTELSETRECCPSNTTVYKCQECGAVFSEDDYLFLTPTPITIYEWWAVSKWFGEKLKELGCVVIDSYGKAYWGRESTGQALSLDGCIIKVAYDMKILEGMENEWK